MIPVLHSDDDFLILDKPSGLAVQPGEGVRICLLDAVERDYGFKPYLVHRLDRETSGCLAVARSPRAASMLSALMGGNGAVKRYRAIVVGRPEPASGILGGKVRVRERMVDAETRYRTLAGAAGFSLVEAELGTGRNHQIRQHLAGAGWPILGDDRHGDFKANKAAAAGWGAKRLMLYACALTLPLQPPVSVTAPAPPHFADFCARVGLENP